MLRVFHLGVNRSLEWAGGNLDTVFTQRRNLYNWRFIRMLRDILRFNKQATMQALQSHATTISLGDFLNKYRYSKEFRDWYLLPMAGCIWSCPTEQMLAFPLTTFVQFCHNHGLLQVNDRPQWHTVKGGARQYVNKMLAAIPNKKLLTPVKSISRANRRSTVQIKLETHEGSQYFDHVVMASHSDQTLRMMHDASEKETAILSAVQYQPNRAVLHTDISLLPQNKKAWSAWNYQSKNSKEPQVCVHYLINQLQPLPFKQAIIVSLNPIEEPNPNTIIDEFDYSHPVFDTAAIEAQKNLVAIQGQQNTWFAGAWTGYGFHEDGLKSGLAVAQAISQNISHHGQIPVAA